MTMPSFDEVVRFHGHRCPGLAIGYRMTRAALAALGVERASDEELVAIVENDACGVDAVQYVAGCTFGKGNLIFRDFGKPVYTFYSRSTGRAVRVLGHGGSMRRGVQADREERIDWMLNAPETDVVVCRGILIAEPPRARLHVSESCDACGEPVMQGRLRIVDGRRLCIPCAKRQPVDE